MKSISLALAAAGLAAVTGAPARAEVAVTASIAPVHSLVARVMRGAGEPTLLLPPGASPHGYALKPSQARALSNSKLVFWVGESLEPWLEKPIEALASGAEAVELAELPGVTTHEVREGGVWAEHDHDHGHDEEHAHKDEHDHDEKHAHKDEHDHDEKHAHKDEHDHDEKHAHKDEHDHDEKHAHKDEHDHDEKHAHKDEHDHDEKHAHKDEHDHHGHDPHLWLDPENAKVWMAVIAAELAEKDPANAALYRKNAAEGSAELDALSAEIAAKLAPARDRPYIVFHDAYQYFEKRFEIPAAGSISLSDAAKPSPARLREIRETIKTRKAACVFTEPQFPPKLANTAAEGTSARVASLDPLGSDLKPGETLYPELLRAMANSLATCLVR